MFKTASSGDNDIRDKIWALLVPKDKQYDVFYDIRDYMSYQQQLADMVPDIRKYCCYHDVAWITDLKNSIYRSSKIEHYCFSSKESGEKLYLLIDNQKCRIYWSFCKI